MRKIHFRAWVIAPLLLLVVPIVAQQGPINPKAVALLRWYPANRATSFNVGSWAGEQGIAFDGANLWIANEFSNAVTKLRASDGAVLGTFTIAAPWDVASDGANVWVTNVQGTVTKLRASDGAKLGTFTVGWYPWGVTFDGAHIWVANRLGNTVTKLRASDGTILGTFPVASPAAIAFDGANIWVANYWSGTVSKM